MIDSHQIYSQEWGIRPILFSINNFQIQSYPFFVGLALMIGIIIYFKEAKRSKTLNDNTFYIAIAALIGGILGAKIPIWIINFKQIIASLPNIQPLLSGRTIVGGLIGGTFSVIAIKKKLGITEKRGNLFAPSIAAGLAIGRIGCFLRGCCCGSETHLPWGVDFGDGIHRHPTQLYEALFAFLLFIYLLKVKNKPHKPGILFQLTLTSYFIFRFFIEYIKFEDKTIWGFTIFQIAIVLMLLNLYRTQIFNYTKQYLKHIIKP